VPTVSISPFMPNHSSGSSTRTGDPTTGLTQVLYRSAPSESMDSLALAVAAPSRGTGTAAAGRAARHRRIAEANALEAGQAAWGRADCCASAGAQPNRRGRPDHPASGMDRSVSSWSVRETDDGVAATGFRSTALYRIRGSLRC
jgi:hypothetical protein